MGEEKAHFGESMKEFSDGTEDGRARQRFEKKVKEWQSMTVTVLTWCGVVIEVSADASTTRSERLGEEFKQV